MNKWITNIKKLELRKPENHYLTEGGRTVGEPKATEAYSVSELEQMGMVGIYEAAK